MPRIRYIKCEHGEDPRVCPRRNCVTKPKSMWKQDGDIIESPNHYVQGIECWDYIVSQNLNYLEGNIVKYVTRYKKKNGLEDLRKAKAYLEKLIKVTESNDESSAN